MASVRAPPRMPAAVRNSNSVAGAEPEGDGRREFGVAAADPAEGEAGEGNGENAERGGPMPGKAGKIHARKRREQDKGADHDADEPVRNRHRHDVGDRAIGERRAGRSRREATEEWPVTFRAPHMRGPVGIGRRRCRRRSRPATAAGDDLGIKWPRRRSGVAMTVDQPISRWPSESPTQVPRSLEHLFSAVPRAVAPTMMATAMSVGDQAVFDGGRAGLVLGETRKQGLHLDKLLIHVFEQHWLGLPHFFLRGRNRASPYRQIPEA